MIFMIFMQFKCPSSLQFSECNVFLYTGEGAALYNFGEQPSHCLLNIGSFWSTRPMWMLPLELCYCSTPFSKSKTAGNPILLLSPSHIISGNSRYISVYNVLQIHDSCSSYSLNNYSYRVLQTLQHHLITGYSRLMLPGVHLYYPTQGKPRHTRFNLFLQKAWGWLKYT